MSRFAPVQLSKGYPPGRSRVCDECQQQFEPRSRTQRYCDGCRIVTLACSVCESPFDVLRTDLAKRPCLYCSMKCKARAADSCVYLNQGRWRVVCRDGSIMLYSRAVCAARLGRLLRADEWVHHVNEDSTDDRDENLQVMAPAAHAAHHAAVRRAAA